MQKPNSHTVEERSFLIRGHRVTVTPEEVAYKAPDGEIFSVSLSAIQNPSRVNTSALSMPLHVSLYHQ